jgi:hypothetical protein
MAQVKNITRLVQYDRISTVKFLTLYQNWDQIKNSIDFTDVQDQVKFETGVLTQKQLDELIAGKQDEQFKKLQDMYDQFKMILMDFGDSEEVNINENHFFEIEQDYGFKDDKDPLGRLYTLNKNGKFSLQGMKRPIRQTIQHKYKDIDIENCQGSIMLMYALKHGLPSTTLLKYHQNRKEWYHLKKSILKIINYSDIQLPEFNSNDDRSFVQQLKSEIQVIHNHMWDNPENKALVTGLKRSNNNFNRQGRLCSKLFCRIESLLLDQCLLFLKQSRIDTRHNVLIFDGFEMEESICTDDLLNSLNQYIHQQLKIMNLIDQNFELPLIKYVYKSQDEIVDLNDFNVNIEILEDELENIGNYPKKYYEWKKEFEKTHCKIKADSCFVSYSKSTNEFKFQTKSQIQTAYEHECCQIKDGKKCKRFCFIENWFKDPHMKCYDYIGVYPPPVQAPKNVLNIWTGYRMDRLDIEGDHPTAIDLFKRHMLILCDHDQVVCDYLIMWVAQLIQFPGVKSITPTLRSEQEGAGKGSLWRLLSNMLGADKVVQSVNPERDVFGEFNSLMSTRILICFDELSKAALKKSEGPLKSLITEGKLIINGKGREPVVIDSYHRIISFSNCEDPIKTSESDRRNLIINCSNELVEKTNENLEYFAKFNNELIENDCALKTIYNYLKNMENIDQFNKLKIPRTTYHQELIQKNESPELCFLKYLVHKADDEGLNYEEMKSEDLFHKFEMWKMSVGLGDYKVQAPTLVLRIGNLKFDGLSKKRTKLFNLTVFEYQKLLKSMTK